MTIYEKLNEARERFKENKEAAKIEYEKRTNDAIYWKNKTLAEQAVSNVDNNLAIVVGKYEAARDTYNTWVTAIDILEECLKGVE